MMIDFIVVGMIFGLTAIMFLNYPEKWDNNDRKGNKE